jgi:glycosyltransferase involved in cell wall biosynthesis
MPRIKTLILVQFLSGGGIAQVFSLLLRNLNPDRFDLHLGVISQDRPATSPLPARITVHRLKATRVRYAALGLLRLIWTVRPQVILSSSSHLTHMLLLIKPFLPPGTRIAGRLETTASRLKLSPTSHFLYRYLYRTADALICQSPPMARDLVEHFGHCPRRLPILLNPIDLSAIRNSPIPTTSPWPTGPGPNLLAIGRLSPEKGFDRLLHALAAILPHYPTLQLALLGTGPEEPRLRSLADRLGLHSNILFAGQVDRPEIYFAQATAFVLSSAFEGMPNAMLEAAAAGLPLVLTPCSPGILDLLSGQPGTWLADSITSQALSDALQTALAELHLIQPPVRYPHSFLAPFDLPVAIPAYEHLLASLARGATL